MELIFPWIKLVQKKFKFFQKKTCFFLETVLLCLSCLVNEATDKKVSGCGEVWYRA